MKKWLCVWILLTGCCLVQAQQKNEFQTLCDSLQTWLEERGGVRTRITLKRILKRNGYIDYYFKENLGDYPFRRDDVAWLRHKIRSATPARYASFKTGRIFAGKLEVGELVCEPYRSDGRPQPSRFHQKKAPSTADPLVWREQGEHFKEGLEGRHIALWDSHGIYFNQANRCWMWQRAPLFGTVEDMLSASIVLPFLVPMLENAGANVLLPRERDFSEEEAIADNDSSRTSRCRGRLEVKGAWQRLKGGFADWKEVYSGTDNPFRSGTALGIKGSRKATASLTWHPRVARRGRYCVYVSYKSLPESTSGAHYTVRHRGGSTSLRVNQKMGGGTWICLGTFDMDSTSTVTLDNAVKDNAFVTGDAVRVGGGTGHIERCSADTGIFMPACTSGKARWAEGARYWLQWAGADSTVYSQNRFLSDYRDDFMSRGAWVTWISGGSRVNPGLYVPPKDPDGKQQAPRPGLGIPVDAALALHTNAGFHQADSTYGTLAIYTLYCEKSRKFPSGEERLCQREFADILQSQMVDDIRAGFHPEWRRRELWDRSYSESRTTGVPTVLMEMLSHQSFNDMRLAHDPRFKFTLARSLYKGLLKYLSARYGVPYKVQPLPVRDFSALLQSDGGVRLSWRETPDSLEPTAKASHFLLYTRVDDGGFDDGKRIQARKAADGRWECSVKIDKGRRYAFRIAAANAGGLSFPSETLSAGISPESKGTVLLVNNFDRVSGPAVVEGDAKAGFDFALDGGVSWGADCSYIGDMYEYRRELPWMDDYCPGFGASWQDYAGHLRGGNRFDYPALLGEDFFENGWSYCSCSASAFAQNDTPEQPYALIDLICGKQTRIRDRFGKTRFEVFPAALRERTAACARQGTHLLVSGSYIASDLWDPVFAADTTQDGRDAQAFVQEILGWRWMTGRASRSGRVWTIRSGFDAAGTLRPFSFCTGMCDSLYRVESPDGIVPARPQAQTIFRYQDNNLSAGVSYQGEGYKAVSIGFPLESINDAGQRKKVTQAVLDYFFSTL